MISWVNPLLCRPPHAVARPDQVVDLANAFIESGWDPKQPALVGYWDPDSSPFTIQLLSGSHRWAAAMTAKMRSIPIRIVPYDVVSGAWGDLEWWAKVMSPPPAGTNPQRQS